MSSITFADRRLTIVAPRGYPWTFNGPRQSRHRVRLRPYMPFNKLRSSLDGVTVFNPIDAAGADLIHAFNRIPVGLKPFVIGFESHLPRTWGLERSTYERWLWRMLLATRCRRIVAISEHAAANFHAGVAVADLPAGAKDELIAKLDMRYPNLAVPDRPATRAPIQTRLIATFVGSHFGRKGGCVAVRMAELAYRAKLPIDFYIISSLQMGGAIWTDPVRGDFFDRYRSLLSLPNITHRPGLPNSDVLRLLERSHVCLLATFADTFGFGVLEAMARGTPALVTAQAALPEFIEHGVDGLLLDPARTPGNSAWIWPYEQRHQPKFERLFEDQVERLAAAGLDLLVGLLNEPAVHSRMSIAAHRKVMRLFNSEDAGTYWDNLYAECIADRRHSVRAAPLAGRSSPQGELIGR